MPLNHKLSGVVNGSVLRRHGMVVFALVCRYKGTWIFERSLHVLPHVAVGVGASVVTPAKSFVPSKDDYLRNKIHSTRTNQ